LTSTLRTDANVPTKEQITAWLGTVTAVADCIRELKHVPSGELYAQLMSRLTFSQYCAIIDTLKNAQLIQEEAHLLTWIHTI
jgi:hypothetical protein